MSADTAAGGIATPNDLESNWLPFTPNRQFKREPRMLSRAKDIYYYKPDGTEVLDATAGLWCCNAGHCRDDIVKAIQMPGWRTRLRADVSVRPSESV